MNLKECYQLLGADYEDVMRRFISEERVKKFLSMVIKDSSFSTLSAAMKAKDYKEAFRAAHTIKGISMNLSLSAMRDSSSALTERLREKQYGIETERLYGQVMDDYQRTTDTIRKLG